MKKILVPILDTCLFCAISTIGCAAPASIISAAKAPVKAQGAVADLRGYGKVTANFAPGRAAFACETAEKADLLLGKLLADMFWDAGADHVQKTVRSGNLSLIVHQQASYGAIVAARAGNRVIVLGAPDEAQVVQAAAKETAFKQAGVKFAPDKQYPIYLDFYDLRAFKFYTWAMSSPNGMGLENHWPFIKKFGLGGMTMQGPATNFGNPGPGVIAWTGTDYEVKQAELNGGMIVPSLWMGGEVAPWMRNDYPYSMMQPTDSALLGAWNGVGPAGASFLSWGLPQAQADATIGQFARQVANRYKDSPAVGGWHLYAGSPGAEMNFHDRHTDMWDYSVAGQEAFREWLRTDQKLSLQQLGVRWYGDAAHFKSWDEVKLPDIRAFYGDLEHGAFRITDNWKWKKSDPEKTEEKAPDTTSNDWVSFAMPPAQEQAYLPWGAAFYRTSFDATNWLKNNDGKPVHLIVDVNTRKDEGTQVWLNGAYLGAFKADAAPGPFQVDVSGKVKDGNNELIVRVPSGRWNPKSDGKLFGPVALTTTTPRFYPYLGKEANARWIDLRQWQVYGIYRSHVLAAQAARAVESNRPIILSASALEMADYTGDLATRFGMGMQFTGREAWYFPWNSRTGQVAGYYGTSEPSATAYGTNLDQTIGYSLIDGDSNIDMFLHIEDYMKQEKETGWFTKHQSLLRLVGKSLPEPAKIVIMHSAETMRLGSERPMNEDIGRGDLHAAHYDYGYAGEREIKKGLVNGAPVLFDSGSEFIDADTLKAIEAYVRNGGTYVTLPFTGRHSLLVPDTYPISELTGFKVAKSDAHGKIRFGNNLPVFKGWENREFGGDGIGLDAKSAVPGAVPLALWEDGSVAVGCRTIGKGRVISLGSMFWRSGGQAQVQFFERLFTDLVVERNAQSSDENIWTRKVVTKNGLQDWLLAYNNNGPRKADVSFKVEAQPQQVLDLLTKKSVEFTYENGWVKVAAVDFDEHGTRAFAVKRSDFTGGLPLWWSEKTKYWQKSEGGTLPPAIPNTRTVVFDSFKFVADNQNTLAQNDDWKQTTYDDSRWQALTMGAWNVLDPKLKDYRGVGLYRSKFTIPANWKGRTVTFNMYDFGGAILSDKGEVFLNGQKVTEYQGHGGSQTYNYDVTKLLKDGENVLSIKVQGGETFSGVTGTLWLEPERALAPTIDLGGDWQAVAGDYLTRKTIKIPGGTQAKYIEREVTIPADWKGRDVFVHIEAGGAGQWMKSVLINGRPYTYNSFLHPFGLRTEINISPYANYGGTNKIQIWPWNTIGQQSYGGESPEDSFDIGKILVGVAAKNN